MKRLLTTTAIFASLMSPISAMAYTGELEVSAEGKIVEARKAARLAFETPDTKAALVQARSYFADKPDYECFGDEDEDAEKNAQLDCFGKDNATVTVEAVPVKPPKPKPRLCAPAPMGTAW